MMSKSYHHGGENLGDKIRLARVEKRLTQQQLADLSGTKQKSISRYETNQVEPSLRALQKIAQALERPISFFLEEDGVSQNELVKRSSNQGDQDLRGVWAQVRRLPSAARQELIHFVDYLEIKYSQG